jgi:GNAT superfamily N-acetyltransferase
MQCSCVDSNQVKCDFSIRPFVAEDANRVLEIRNTNLKRADSKDYPEHIIQRMIATLTSERLVELSKDPDRVILVAVSNAKIVGTSSLYKDDVRLMFVDPDFHRCGIGKELLGKIESIAREKGIKKLSLKSALPAEVFYTRFGFVKYGTETNEMGPVILMTKQL